jgi:hypothetical protein
MFRFFWIFHFLQCRLGKATNPSLGWGGLGDRSGRLKWPNHEEVSSSAMGSLQSRSLGLGHGGWGRLGAERLLYCGGRCHGPPLVKAGQSGHSRSTSTMLNSGMPRDWAAPEAVLVGSSSPALVVNHQQVERGGGPRLLPWARRR